MARLDARWGNFWQRGQIWYHFNQDTPFAGAGEVAGSLSAAAIIQRTSGSTPSADAVVFRVQTGSPTADAVLHLAQSGSLTADAIVQRIQPGSASADALVFRTQTGSPTADALVLKTSEVALTADAILHLVQFGSAPTDAIVHREQLSTFLIGDQADPGGAWISTTPAAVTYEESFTAGALIVRQIFEDTFTRTVDVGWGNGYLGDDGQEPNAYVDGSVGVVRPDTTYETMTGLNRPRVGYIAFDIYVPADTTDDRFFEIDGGEPLDGTVGEGVYVTANGFGDYHVELWGSGLTYDFTPDASTWYSIKVYFENTVGTPIHIKVWKQSDPEPDVWSASGTNAAGFFDEAGTWAYTYEAHDLRIDNIRAWTASDVPFTYHGPLTANAILKKTISFVGVPAPFSRGHLKSTSWSPVTSRTILKSPLAAAGDQMVMSVITDSASNSRPTMVSGWTEIDAVQQPDGSWASIFTRIVASSGEPTSYTVSVAVATGMNAVLSTFRNTVGTPSVSHVTTSASPYDTITAPTIADAPAGFKVEVFFSSSWSPGAMSTPSGMTLGIDAQDYYIQQSVSYGTHVSGTAGGDTTTITNPDGGSPVRGAFLLFFTSPPSGPSVNAIRQRTIAPTPKSVDAIRRKEQSLTFLMGDQDNPGGAWIVAPVVVEESLSAGAILMPRAFADAIFLKTQVATATAGAWIYAPRQDPEGPGEPNETPLVSIMVDGTDITEHVVVAGATFTMQVNGLPGAFSFIVRDDAHGLDFTSGSEVTVDIDGKRKFGGYATSIKRKFFFPVQGTASPTDVSRAWLLEGVDYNILFNKRVAWFPPNPTKKFRSWPIGSRDDVVIKYVFDNYTDLDADGVTYEGVTHVGSINPDMAGVVGSPGLMFGNLMTEINRLIGGVFYIDQYKDLNFVDVDTPNASLGLSDNPTAPGVIGYRELMQIEAGSKLANDAMVWGAALGSKNLRFARSQDTASIAAHGRWQYGEFTTQMYKQASVNERASTVVYGTDQNKRGGKDDQDSWTVVTFDNSFSAGQKVAIESDVFGKSDVVPIRRCTLTFETKTKPRYQLTLSHEIDLPWNTFEQRWPRQSSYNLPEIDLECFTCGVQPGLPECDCGQITDTFTRTSASGWGATDTGLEWVTQYGTFWTDGSVGLTSGYGETELISPDMVQNNQLEATFDFEIAGTDATRGFGLYFGPSYLSVEGGTHNDIYIQRLGGPPNWSMNVTYDTVADFGFAVTDGLWHVHILVDATTTHVNLWADGDTEPTGWMCEATADSPYDFTGANWGTGWTEDEWITFNIGGMSPNDTTKFDNIYIVGVDRCSQYHFDTFNRTLVGSWGTTDTGYPWIEDFNNMDPGEYGVSGGSGWVSAPVAGGRQLWAELAPQTGSPWMSTPHSFRCRFQILGALGPVINFGTASAGSWINRWYFWADNTTPTNNVSIELPGGDDTWLKQDWALGVWYIAEAEMDEETGIAKFRIYTEGSTPPAWWENAQGPVVDPSAYFRFWFTWIPPTCRVNVDYLDFNYVGKPCYGECSDPVVVAGGTPTITRRGVSQSLPSGAHGTGGGTTAFLADYPFGDTLESETRSCFNIKLPADAIAAGATHARVQARIYSTSILPPTYAVPSDWVIYEGGWSGDETVTPTWDTCLGPAIMSGSVAADGPYVVGGVSLAGASFSGVDFIVPVNAEGSARFVVAWGAQSYVNGFSGTPAVIVSAPRYPNFVDALVSQSDSTIWMQKPDRTTTNFSTASEAFACSYVTSAATGGKAYGQDCVHTDPTEGAGTDALLGRSALVGDGVKKVFNVGAAYYPGSTKVYVNGHFFRPGYEYTESSPNGGDITFTNAPAEGADIDIFYDASGAIF